MNIGEWEDENRNWFMGLLCTVQHLTASNGLAFQTLLWVFGCVDRWVGGNQSWFKGLICAVKNRTYLWFLGLLFRYFLRMTDEFIFITFLQNRTYLLFRSLLRITETNSFSKIMIKIGQLFFDYFLILFLAVDKPTLSMSPLTIFLIDFPFI